jgi:hypothetical protein
MGVIISASEDFNFGKYAINDADVTRQSLKEYVKQNEKRFLYELLGVELAELLIADLDADKEPVTDRFIKIFDPLAFNWSHRLVMSKGIKEILKGFVYSEFVREQNYKNNINGSSRNLYEQGEVISANSAGITHKYNEAIDSFLAIQLYINENRDDYPEFEGVIKHYTSLI